MAGGVPLPLMAKLIKNLSECTNGFEPDEDELMEETRTVRPPRESLPDSARAPSGGCRVRHTARPRQWPGRRRAVEA